MGRPRKFPIDGETEEEYLDNEIGKKQEAKKLLREELEMLLNWIDTIGYGDLARMPEETPKIVSQAARMRSISLRKLLKEL